MNRQLIWRLNFRLRAVKKLCFVSLKVGMLNLQIVLQEILEHSLYLWNNSLKKFW
ncbi:hypothetical protein NTGHW29_120005 [Candidatus Nitrotoga sp. HW29]|nr:hypothetical protein NTGHW29_120005 [Candidatus Nitrotoga sp. HW29]